MGIGSAHKDGLKYAYKNRYNIILTMDADGTHDPKYINNLEHLKNTNILNNLIFYCWDEADPGRV